MKSKACMLALLVVLTAGVAHANTITVSGGTSFVLNYTNFYSFSCSRFGCFGIFPHGSTTTVAFNFSLPSLPVGQVASANLTLGGLLNTSFSQSGGLGENWFTRFNGGFSSITVGSVTDPLGLSSGTLGLTDPALLAALGTGAPIQVNGIASVFTAPSTGHGNPTACGFSSTCFSSSVNTVFLPQTPFAQLSTTLTPEPESLMLFSTGLLSLAGLVRLRLRR